MTWALCVLMKCLGKLRKIIQLTGQVITADGERLEITVLLDAVVSVARMWMKQAFLVCAEKFWEAISETDFLSGSG